MAGSNPAFSGTSFRAAIRSTMQMGMPVDESERLTWHWRRDRTYVPADQSAEPWDWAQEPIVDEPGNPSEPDGSVQVDYALEFSARPAGSSETLVGQFDTSRAIVTLLDEDYDLVRSADFVTIAEAEYEIDFSGPPTGMFDVTIYTVYLTARDEA